MELFKQLYPDENLESYAKLVFNGFDTDHNKKITFDEFLKTIGFLIDNGRNEVLILNEEYDSDFWRILDLVFEMYDKDKNGKLDKREMKKMLFTLIECHGNDPKKFKNKVEDIFFKIDSDHSNYIEKDEFKKFFISNSNSF